MCSIPDPYGNYKESKVEMNVVHAVLKDIEMYNYVDVVFRKYRMGILSNEINGRDN